MRKGRTGRLRAQRGGCLRFGGFGAGDKVEVTRSLGGGKRTLGKRGKKLVLGARKTASSHSGRKKKVCRSERKRKAYSEGFARAGAAS